MPGEIYNLTAGPVTVHLKYDGVGSRVMVPPWGSIPVPSADSLTEQARNLIRQSMVLFIPNVAPAFGQPTDASLPPPVLVNAPINTGTPQVVVSGAGTYTVSYVSGSVGFWGDNRRALTTSGGSGYRVSYTGVGGPIDAPIIAIDSLVFNSNAEVEAYYAGRSLTITVASGSVSIYLYDDVPGDNTGSTVVFSVQRIS